MTLEKASIMPNSLVVDEHWTEPQNDDWDEMCGAEAEKEYEQAVDEYWTEPKNEIIDELSGYEEPEYDKKYDEGDEANEETKGTDTKPVKQGEAKWCAFMGHIAHSEFEYLDNEMAKLNAPYVMSAETSGYEHFHFLAKITVRQYHNFSKKVFKDKYQLHGRWWKNKAGKNQPRQYGKVNKEIRDLSKMMSYTLKDKNFRTNMEISEIEKILKKKIDEVENTKDGEIKDKMIDFVNEHIKTHLANYVQKRHEKYIRVAIIKFMIDMKQNIIKSTVERYYWYYVANTEYECFKLNEYAIYDELYNQMYA